MLYMWLLQCKSMISRIIFSLYTQHISRLLSEPLTYYSQWRGNEFESGGHRSKAKVGGTDPARSARIFFVVPLHFLVLKAQLVVLVSAFVIIITVWSVSCLLSSYSRCPHAQPFVKVGRGTCPRAPWSRCHWLQWNNVINFIVFCYVPVN